MFLEKVTQYVVEVIRLSLFYIFKYFFFKTYSKIIENRYFYVHI